MKLSSGKVGQRNADDAEECVEGSHEGIVDLLGVLLAGLELEGTIVTSKDSRETNKHLPERRVDIEVVLVFDVVATELSKAARVH